MSDNFNDHDPGRSEPGPPEHLDESFVDYFEATHTHSVLCLALVPYLVSAVGLVLFVACWVAGVDVLLPKYWLVVLSVLFAVVSMRLFRTPKQDLSSFRQTQEAKWGQRYAESLLQAGAWAFAGGLLMVPVFTSFANYHGWPGAWMWLVFFALYIIAPSRQWRRFGPLDIGLGKFTMRSSDRTHEMDSKEFWENISNQVDRYLGK